MEIVIGTIHDLRLILKSQIIKIIVMLISYI